MKNIIIAIIFGITFTQPILAAGPESHVCPSSSCSWGDSSLDDTSGCTQKSARCYTFENGHDIAVFSCDKCTSSNAKLVSKGTHVDGCANDISYSTCECPSCSGCTSTSWTSAGTGKEQKVTATCDCGTCKKTTEYRCTAGYYGSGTSCSPCPGYGTSETGSTSQSNCYLSGPFSDNTGSGTYVGKCYYN